VRKVRGGGREEEREEEEDLGEEWGVVRKIRGAVGERRRGMREEEDLGEEWGAARKVREGGGSGWVKMGERGERKERKRREGCGFGEILNSRNVPIILPKVLAKLSAIFRILSELFPCSSKK